MKKTSYILIMLLPCVSIAEEDLDLSKPESNKHENLIKLDNEISCNDIIFNINDNKSFTILMSVLYSREFLESPNTMAVVFSKTFDENSAIAKLDKSKIDDIRVKFHKRLSYGIDSIKLGKINPRANR